nr:MAG TPA_asm: hypothetical protein [Caudoviricetes sp.]
MRTHCDEVRFYIITELSTCFLITEIFNVPR